MFESDAEFPASLKALSVRQPFASAIVRGHKLVENRTWATKYRGPLLIHAGGTRYQFDPEYRSRQEDELARVGLDPVATRSLPRGAIIGMVELVDCIPVSDCPRSPWAAGPWCWVLRNPIAFEAPVFQRGWLSLFSVDLSRGGSAGLCDSVRAGIRQMLRATMS